MRDFVDGTAFNNEQGNRARKLFAAVVLAALDDAIADDKKYGNGPEQIARWARSRDGREVLPVRKANVALLPKLPNRKHKPPDPHHFISLRLPKTRPLCSGPRFSLALGAATGKHKRPHKARHDFDRP